MKDFAPMLRRGSDHLVPAHVLLTPGLYVLLLETGPAIEDLGQDFLFRRAQGLAAEKASHLAVADVELPQDVERTGRLAEQGGSFVLGERESCEAKQGKSRLQRRQPRGSGVFGGSGPCR